MKRQHWQNPLCPVDASHGRLIAWPTATAAWLCPHASHDGRPASHPLGAAPATPSRFTTDLQAVPVPRSGQQAIPVPAGPTGAPEPRPKARRRAG